MRFGPCMCGDTHCNSCGPAQGNYKCIICGSWADDGCEHLGEDGDILPEFKEQAERMIEDERKAEEEFARELYLMDHGGES